MDQQISFLDVAREVGKILTEIGLTIGKVVGVFMFFVVVIVISAFLAVLIGPYINQANESVISLFNMVPSIVWTMLNLVASLFWLVVLVSFIWGIWETAKDRVSNEMDTDYN